MKKTHIKFLVIVLAIIVVLFLIFGFSKPSDDATRASVSDLDIDSKSERAFETVSNVFEKIPINLENSDFEFEGFGPGKSHIGTFNEMSGFLLEDNGRIVGIEGTVKVDSVNTGIKKLDSHLMSDDFFDSEKYPEISFKTNSLIGNEITGTLVFRGVVQKVIYPVEISDNTISADFILDTEPFNFKYIGINKEVRIAFSFSK